MEDTIKIRKDKIKNVAIVFLSIMLVLTFFSNSILNRALPEVATEYVRYDTITERVRGTGVVEADDPYKVVAEDTRTIESVAVSVGDVVAKDQVLFYLEDKESEELKEQEDAVKEKEAELSKQILDYTTALLSIDISNQAFLNIQSGNIATLTAYQAQIEASRQKVDHAQATVDSLERQKAMADISSDEDIDRTEEIEIAKINLASAQKRVDTANQNVTTASDTVNALEEKAATAGVSLDIIALDAKNNAQTALDDYKSKQGELNTLLEGFNTDASEETNYSSSSFFDSNQVVINLAALEELQTLAKAYDEQIGTGALAKFEEMKGLYNNLLTAQTKQKEAEADYSNYINAKNQLASAQSELQIATQERDSYQNKINKLEKKNVKDNSENEELKRDLDASLQSAKASLTEATKEQEQLLKDISKELALSSQNDDIKDTEEELEELREELEELRAKSTGSTIVAPVDGTIISVDRVAGESTMPQEAVATIQVAGKGMKVSFSVTNAQAAKVKVGDKAELQNAWYYSDVMITLDKIKPDKEDPGKKKLLEFVVEGSVADGESLSLSVGERSAEYEHVVPNSAIREDNNGKFIFIIEEKSTPFGNRYKAKRVDVEVLASDEINTAVQADLQGYEYVITTSNQPVEAGDQVRLNS